jgi:hypothetical protein
MSWFRNQSVIISAVMESVAHNLNGKLTSMTSLEFFGGLMSIEPGIPALGEHVDMQGGVHANESNDKGACTYAHSVFVLCTATLWCSLDASSTWTWLGWGVTLHDGRNRCVRHCDAGQSHTAGTASTVSGQQQCAAWTAVGPSIQSCMHVIIMHAPCMQWRRTD